MPKYDIVVVGAGNAGLSAALQCQLAGRKTLLIEKHNVPGGAATSFVRGRFEIEPSLHELCDFGPADNPGDVRNILDAYGVKLDWYECKDCFRIVSRYSDGSPMDVTMPAGIEAFIDKMEVYVPGSREKMEQLFALFQEVLDGISYITASKGHADSKVLQADYPNMLRSFYLSHLYLFMQGALPMLLVLLFGQQAVDAVLAVMPAWFTAGLNVAAGILPVTGFAMLLTFMPFNKFWYFAVAGYVCAAYLNLPVLPIALIGMVIAICYFKLHTEGVAGAGVAAAITDGGELEDE